MGRRALVARRSALLAFLRNPSLLGLPAIAFVGLFAIWPILNFLAESFVDGGRGSLVHYRILASSGTFAAVMARTLATAATVTAICVVLAYPVAYALTKASGAMKTVLIGLVALPYLTSVIVRTYAWAAILSLEGPLNSTLVALGILDRPLLLGHSDFGTMIGMIHILLPIAVLTLWSTLQKIDLMQQTVAASLGATKIEAFLTVFLPQSARGLTAVASLVYILALGAYVIPATLGGTRGLLFAQMVVEQATSLLNWNLAGAMATVMLAAAVVPVVLFAAWRAASRRLFAKDSVGRLGSLVERTVLPLLNRIPDRLWTHAWRSATLTILVFLLLPQLVVVLFSFGPERQITLPPAYWTFDGYGNTLSDPSWTEPLRRSLVYAAVDAAIAALLGTLAAYGFARGRPTWGRVGTALLVAPVILPEIVFAIGYFIFANRWGLSGTAAGIILGQAAGTVGLVVVMLSGTVRQIDVSLEDAASMCGAPRWRVLGDVVVPLMAPGILVAVVYGFLHALDNLVLPLFIAGTNDTAPVRMFLSLQEELTSSPAVIASILIAALATGLAAALALSRRSSLALPVLRDEKG